MNGDPFPLGCNLTIGRTFMTFFDFDTRPGDTNAVEMMQMGPQVREQTQRTSTHTFLVLDDTLASSLYRPT